MEEREGLPVVQVAGQGQWQDWLERHPDAPGCWLVIAKKDSGLASPTYAQSVDEALCVGWVDGKTMKRDSGTYVVRFTPRRPRSVWSQINREHVARLLEQGRMRPGGLAAVERAKANGQWERAYAPPSRAEVPDDLRAALDADPAAAEAFAGLSAGNRFAVLYRVQDARRPETRARRIESYVATLARGDKPFP